MSMMVSFVLSFFPRDVLDEILTLIGSVSEGFPSYSSNTGAFVVGAGGGCLDIFSMSIISLLFLPLPI